MKYVMLTICLIGVFMIAGCEQKEPEEPEMLPIESAREDAPVIPAEEKPDVSSKKASYKDLSIVFSSDRDGSGIYKMDWDGNNVTQMAVGDFGGIGSPYSPDGKTIVYKGYGNKEDIGLIAKYDLAFHTLLYLMDSDGSNKRRAFDIPVFLYRWHDNESIVFTSSYQDPANKSKDGIVSSNTFILDLKTKKFKKYPGEYDMFDIDFADKRGELSFDKKKVLVVAKENYNLEIFSMNFDGTGRINLTNNPAHDSSPFWQPAP